MLVALLLVTCAWSASSIRSNSIDFSADLDVVRSFSIGNRSIVYGASNKANIKFLENDWDRQCVQQTAWEWRDYLAGISIDVMGKQEINVLLENLWIRSDQAKLLKDSKSKSTVKDFVKGLGMKIQTEFGLDLRTATRYCKRDDKRCDRGAVSDCIKGLAEQGKAARPRLFQPGFQIVQATQGRGGKPGSTLLDASTKVVGAQTNIKLFCRLVHGQFKYYETVRTACRKEEENDAQGREELANLNFNYRNARTHCTEIADAVEQDKPKRARARLITKLQAELNDPVVKKDKTCQTFPYALCPEGTFPNPKGKCACVHQTCDWKASTSTCELAAAHPHPAFGGLPYPGLKCISVEDECVLMPCNALDLSRSAYHLNDTDHTKYHGTFGQQSSDGKVGGKIGQYNCLSEKGTRQSGLDLMQIITDPRPEGFQSYNSPMARGVLYDHLVPGEYVAPQQPASAPKPVPTVTEAPATEASTTRAGEDFQLTFDN